MTQLLMDESYLEKGYVIIPAEDGTEVALPVAFQLDNVSIGEAMVEPVRDEADYSVDEDGKVELFKGDGEGRIIVNRSENPVEEKAAQAGGPTD